MNRKAVGYILILNLLVAVVLAATGVCQGAGEKPYCPPKTSEMPTVSFKGKVVYDQRSYNYMFHQQEPPKAVLFILNNNYDELKALAAKQQNITVEGFLPMGADHLFIYKIDGKKFGKCK
jgi:hypothetical protein